MVFHKSGTKFGFPVNWSGSLIILETRIFFNKTENIYRKEGYYGKRGKKENSKL